MSLGRKQVKGTPHTVVIRGRRLSDLKPKRMSYDEFKNSLSTVTVRECQLVITLRAAGLNQDDILFLERAIDAEPRAIDAVFELLLKRLKPFAAQEQERPDASTTAVSSSGADES